MTSTGLNQRPKFCKDRQLQLFHIEGIGVGGPDQLYKTVTRTKRDFGLLFSKLMGWWCCPDGNIKRWRQRGAFGHQQCCLPFSGLSLCICVNAFCTLQGDAHQFTRHIYDSPDNLFLYLSSIAKLINYPINNEEVNTLKQPK